MANLTPATVIAAIKADLEAIEGIGLVYDRRRDVRDEASAKAVWYSEPQGRIHAWSITMADGHPAQSIRHPGFGPRGSGQKGTVLTRFGIVIEGVFGINDADDSETTFRNLCWSIVHSFNGIGLIHHDVTQQDPLQWEKFSYLLLAGMYSVHFARFAGGYLGRTAP